MKSSDWPRLLEQCLQTTQFMALATAGREGLWNHAVYFAWGEDLSMYFMSQPTTRHMHNIAREPQVAIGIFSTDQSPQKDVVGLQIRGLAEILPDEKVPEAHGIYFKRAPVIEGIPHILDDFLGVDATWKLVRVIPQEIGYFNSALFGEKRQTVPGGIRL